MYNRPYYNIHSNVSVKHLCTCIHAYVWLLVTPITQHFLIQYSEIPWPAHNQTYHDITLVRLQSCKYIQLSNISQLPSVTKPNMTRCILSHYQREWCTVLNSKTQYQYKWWLGKAISQKQHWNFILHDWRCCSMEQSGDTHGTTSW